ncbi:hypothetical protein B0H13DRAFT_2531818 [Mycena leptocephala]|nr:hypothetical protein B0H13DRAFT_2531818 [Mycena leptocephala]
MSLLVEGSLVSSLGFAPTSRTVLSRSFYDSLQRPAVRLLFTTTVVPYGTCSTVLHCDVSPTANFDVVLGHDWAFLFRDHLISIGHRLSTSFDPWQLFLTASVNTRTEPLGGFIGTKSASVFPRLNRLLAPALPVSQPIQSIPASTVPPALKRSRARSGLKVKQYVPPTGKFLAERGQSSKSSSSFIRREDIDGNEILAELLLSADNDANVFVMAPKLLIKLLNSHHIAKPQDLTIHGARHALLTHLLTGQAQSFAVLSILISASEDRLPDSALKLVAECLGLNADERSTILKELNRRRRRLASEHQSSHTARTLFEHLDSLHKGTLLSIAQAHGILLDRPTSESLRNTISEHVAMGQCVTHEGFAPFLGCSSLESEFLPPAAASPCDDPPFASKFRSSES